MQRTTCTIALCAHDIWLHSHTNSTSSLGRLVLYFSARGLGVGNATAFCPSSSLPTNRFQDRPRLESEKKRKIRNSAALRNMQNQLDVQTCACRVWACAACFRWRCASLCCLCWCSGLMQPPAHPVCGERSSLARISEHSTEWRFTVENMLHSGQCATNINAAHTCPV